MQFRNFTWPNEPSSLRVTSRRRTALLEEPGGGWTLQGPRHGSADRDGRGRVLRRNCL